MGIFIRLYQHNYDERRPLIGCPRGESETKIQKTPGSFASKKAMKQESIREITIFMVRSEPNRFIPVSKRDIVSAIPEFTRFLV